MKLIGAEKEKGYLTYNEVNDLIPHDVHSPEDLDDLLTTFALKRARVLEAGPVNRDYNNVSARRASTCLRASSTRFGICPFPAN
jgi:hypothetical protein